MLKRKKVEGLHIAVTFDNTKFCTYTVLSMSLMQKYLLAPVLAKLSQNFTGYINI